MAISLLLVFSSFSQLILVSRSMVSCSCSHRRVVLLCFVLSLKVVDIE